MNVPVSIPSKMWEANLACPSCGEEYLHHTLVEVWNRSTEDSVTGLHARVDGDTFWHDDRMQGNPSGRRDGIRISFWCEHCGPGYEPGDNKLESLTLVIVQHKGNTDIHWDVVHDPTFKVTVRR